MNIKMSLIFINLENSNTSDAHRLRLNPMNKINLLIGDNGVVLSNVSI